MCDVNVNVNVNARVMSSKFRFAEKLIDFLIFVLKSVLAVGVATRRCHSTGHLPELKDRTRSAPAHPARA